MLLPPCPLLISTAPVGSFPASISLLIFSLNSSTTSGLPPIWTVVPVCTLVPVVTLTGAVVLLGTLSFGFSGSAGGWVGVGGGISSVTGRGLSGAVGGCVGSTGASFF